MRIKMKTQTSHKKILTLTTILLAGTIILSLSPIQINAQNTTMQKGINYLSYGNAWTEPTSILQNDFERFKQDHIQYLSIRVMWSVMMPTLGNVSTVALENIKKVLNTANTYGLKVNLAFWTQFGSNLGFPSWAGTNYYSLLDEPTKTYYLNYLAQTVDQLKTFPAIDSYSILNEPYYSNITQKIPFQTLMADCVQTIKTVDTTHPVTCRFALSYTPATGKYDTQIYSLFDAFTVTVYLNASNPTDKIYNSKWDDYEKTVQECKELGLPLWVIEFGTKTTDDIAAQSMFEANLAKFCSDGIVRAYAWAWQTRNASNETFNIYNGTTPKPAYYALTQTTTNSSSTNSASNSTTSTSTPKPAPTTKPTSTPTPTPTSKPQSPNKRPSLNWSTIRHASAVPQATPAAADFTPTMDIQQLNILCLGLAVVFAVFQLRIKKWIFKRTGWF
jgi:hypothetical protein